MNDWFATEDMEKIFSPKKDFFSEMLSLQGEVYRALEGRSTERVMLNNKAYFIKKHYGVGWREIVKNIMQCRLPVISAKNEYKALITLQRLGLCVPEVVAYGCRGNNPANMQSFIMTKELPNHISLEDFCSHWMKCPPAVSFKRKMIKEVATIARIMHTYGINHRDFYICHFLLDVSSLINSTIKMYLIDLHRAQMRNKVPERWLVKDLAGLYFSSKEVGLTKRDILRFVIEYRNKPLHEIIDKELPFWLKVKKRGDDLYRREKNKFSATPNIQNTLPCESSH